jgi:murein peptide amidase A
VNSCFVRGRLAPSILLLWVLSLPFALAGCAWISLDERPEISTEVQQQDPRETAEPSVDVQPTIIEAKIVEPTEVERIAIESLEPLVEHSYFGIPEAEEDLSIFELCHEIGNKLGSVSVDSCLSQQLVSNGGLSVLGRPLAIREFAELPNRTPLGRVLLIGGIHGDEFSAVSIVFKWMQILDQHHSGIFEWRFVPVSNPDGLLAEDSRRQNEMGVDLNRNFPSADWDELALNFWRERTRSNERRYPGPEAGSEPEVAWLVKQIKDFQPDVIISVHAPYHLVDYDGPPDAPQKLGDLHLSKLGVYPGSLGNYAGVDLDMPVVTIELPYAGILPRDDQISMMWTDLVAWLIEEQSESGD